LERGLVIPQESVWERISALKDIIPPSTRQSIVNRVSKASSYASVGLLIGGKIAWVVTTTALLVGLPYALSVEDEMRISQQERDMMSQQQGAQSVSIGPCVHCYSSHMLTSCLFHFNRCLVLASREDILRVHKEALKVSAHQASKTTLPLCILLPHRPQLLLNQQ
jgi:hypothetical protein